MKRFYVPRTRWKGERAKLSVEQCRHLTRVLRMGLGDHIAVFDGEREYEARIVEANKGGAWCEIIAVGSRSTRPSIEFILAPAILKAKGMDMVIEKATELGVSRIQPFVCSRCVVKVNSARLNHWQKISESATAQSEHVKVPDINMPLTYDELLKIDADMKVILWEREKESGIERITDRWKEIKASPATVLLMVGPEGGFSEEDVQSARDNGFLTWGLGSAVLRAETASIAGLAILTHALAGKLD